MSKPTTPIRILLADDHAVLRDGLLALIAAQNDMAIAGAVSTGRSAVRLAEKMRPDVVVMDIGMPDLNGIDATRKIIRATPHMKVLCLSMYKQSTMIEAMFRAGASGYLVKDCAGRELLDAIRAVASGKSYISPSIAGDVVRKYVSDDNVTRGGVYSELTTREREILQLIAEGQHTKAIASTLDISDKTVAAHRLNLMSKLDAHSVADLTRCAIRQGLITP